MGAEGSKCVPIARDADIVEARTAGRALATSLGFSRTDGTLIATAISEVARNILVHAGAGEIRLTGLCDDQRFGVEVVALDSGPGIPDIQQAMQDGWGSASGLGLGLSGARRLVDEFCIESSGGEGTTVTMTKWRNRDLLKAPGDDQAVGARRWR